MRIKKFNVAFLAVLAILGMAPFVKSVQSTTDAERSGDRGKATPASQKDPTYGGYSLSELIAALSDKDFQVRIRAVDFLGLIGPAAKPAVPALLDALNEERLRELVLNSLGNIGVGAEEAIPALIKAIAEYASACRWYAAEALAKIGEAAVSALKEATASENMYLRIWSNAALAYNEGPDSPHLRYLVGPMNSENKRMSEEALRAMKMLGRKSEPLVPDLIEAMKDPKISHDLVAEVLTQIGQGAKSAVPELLERLASKKYNERFSMSYPIEAIRAIGAIGGREAKSAVPLLIQALNADDTSDAFTASQQPRIRAEAAKTLGKIGPGAGPAIPSLVNALGDEDKWVRRNAAEAIGSIDPTNLEAVPALVEAIKDESGRVRVAVAQTLLKFGPVNRDVIQSFIHASGDNWKGVIYACDEFFALLDPKHRYAVPELAKMAETPEPRSRRLAIGALIRIGDIPVELVPALVEALQDHHEGGPSLYAEKALVMLGPKAKAAVPHLIEMLDEKFWTRKFTAARILAAIGTAEAREAIPVIERYLKESPHIRLCEHLLQLDPQSTVALQALERIAKSPMWHAMDILEAHYQLAQSGHNPQHHLQALVDGLESESLRKLSAAVYLGKLGSLATKGIPSLQKALEDNNPQVRIEAAHAILLISSKRSERKQAVNVIINSLDEKECMARVRAATALGSFGLGEKWTVPVLITKVHDGDVRTRIAAIKSLGNIGPAAREALPSLGRLLKDEHWQIRQSAAKTIEKICH